MIERFELHLITLFLLLQALEPMKKLYRASANWNHRRKANLRHQQRDVITQLLEASKDQEPHAKTD